MRDLPHPASIKTSPPSLAGVIERARLIKALTDLPAAAKWLQSPSGTGKSTLAASYARSRKKALVWYRLDERDNDPAFFYDEFERALRAQMRTKVSLPKFSGDDHDRQQQFAQRFAEPLRLQLAKQPSMIVLDDAQRVTSLEMQRALAALISVSVDRSELLFVSEASAPTAFFDAIAARQLVLLNDADLHFDVDECRAMATSLRVGGVESDSIAVLTGGHAGALVLACELLRGTNVSSALGATTVERIHSHLLTKLVERMPQPRRELLLQTAFVAQLTRAIAEELAGHEAARQLDGLVESGLLRRVSDGTNEAFEAHGLVRQGMQALVRTQRGTTETRTHAEHTATILVSSGQAEAAFSVLAEIGSTLRAIAVLEGLAEHYAARGQTDLLSAAIVKMPQAEVYSRAWLCFWAGQAFLRVDEQQAREWFEHAYVAFLAQGDRLGMRVAAACIVTAFGLECGDFRQLDIWIERHSDAGGDEPIGSDEKFATTLSMGVICAAFVRGRYPPQIDPEQLVARMRLLLDLKEVWLSDDQRIQAARALIEHGMVFGSFELARAFVLATRFLVDSASAGALHRGRWLISAAWAYFARGELRQSLQYLIDAQALNEKFDSPRLSFELFAARAEYWIKALDLARAAEELTLLEPIATTSPPAQRAQFARMKGRLLLLQGKTAEGLHWTIEAKKMALPAGFSGANLRVFEFDLIYALTANGRIEEAIELASGVQFNPPELPQAVEHCVRFLHGGPSAAPMLKSGVEAAARHNFLTMFATAREPLAHICDRALASNIEPEFVLRLISFARLDPPPAAGPYWPWAVHVRTLGGFRLDVQGKRYRPAHKTQDKPLELLKLLVTTQAMGRNSAEKTWIAERLWPDAEPANARKSLDMTLARLRRLLSDEDAVTVAEGRVQLSLAKVWTDVRPLREAVSQVRTHRDERATGKPESVDEAVASIAAVLEHYRGPFLAEEDDAPWVLAGREAIATSVRQALLLADSVLDGSTDESLIPAIESALSVDPTSEDLARALMRAQLRQGRSSDTLRVYRRLREMLSVILGVTPSAESDRLRDQAYACEASKGGGSSTIGVGT